MGTPLEQPSSNNRLLLLDVLRGLAIIGTFLVNYGIFISSGTDEGIDFTGDAGIDFTREAEIDFIPDDEIDFIPDDEFIDNVDPWSVDSVVHSFIEIFANGKAYALLSIMFGVGVAIQFDSAARRGLHWPGKYNWRAIFLFIEGTIHFLFVFEYDVLMGYAVTALLVAWLLTRSQRMQDVAMVIAGVVHFIILTLSSWGEMKIVDRFRGMSDEEFRVRFDARMGMEDGYFLGSGSYLDDVVYKFTHFFDMRSEPMMMFPMTVFLFLLGVRLYRGGVFNNDARGRRIRNRLLIFGLGIGLPLAVCSNVWIYFGMFDRYGIPMIVALGYIGLVGFILDRIRKVGPLTTGLASLGRAAMTGYVLQNVLMVLILPPLLSQVNLGVVGDFGGIGVILFFMLFSYVWLKRFSHGPLEMVQKWALSKIPDRPARRKDVDENENSVSTPS